MKLFTNLCICVAFMLPSMVFTQSASYELSTDSTTYDLGETVTVSWQTDSSNIFRDWVGLYKTDANNRNFIKWKYIKQKDGTLDFDITQPGNYEFRYFPNSSYNQVAKSAVFTIKSENDQTDSEDNTENDTDNSEEYKLTLNKNTITAGDKISVTWSKASTNRDWIGLYKPNTTASGYLQWSYLKNDNSLDFTISEPGTYEFRQYLNNGYTQITSSEEITVTPKITEDNPPPTDNTEYSLITDKISYPRDEIARVTWSVPSNQSSFLNWIGLYRPEANDRQFIKFEYVDFLSNTETFRLDNDGTYEFRFFSNNSFNKLATSKKIVVGNNNSSTCALDTSNITNLPTKSGPIIAFGDSITFGVGASDREDYVSELEDRLGVNIINKGIKGDTTRDALSRLNRDVLNLNPSAVIIFLGGNDEIRRFYAELSDTLTGRNLQDNLDDLAENIGYDWENVPLIPRSETFSNLETIINRIQNTGAVTIVVGFDTIIYDSRIDDNYRQIAEDTGSFYVPDIYDSIFGRSRYMSDLVHPNDAGYDIVADRIQPAVACVI